MRKILIFLVTALIFGLSPGSFAVTILSGPTFTPAPNAPLAGTLQLTTDVGSRVSVVVGAGTNVWERDFYDYSTNHSLPLLGFKPGQTNEILVTAYDLGQNTYASPHVLTFVTAPLPSIFPTSKVLTNEPDLMEPGYTLFVIENRAYNLSYLTIMDNQGSVVWYSPDPQSSASDVRQLNDGNLLLEEGPPGNCFLEINMLGETVNTLYPPAGYPVNAHEALVTAHGTILYISDTSVVVSNFPSVLPVINSSETNPPLVTVNADDNPVVEISATNGALVNVWSPLSMIDPTRVTYLSGDFPTSYGVDNVHANAIIEDTNDNSIILSMRDQNAVIKFSRSTGRLKWILGPPENWPADFQPYLLAPVGTPFDWNYGQHAPMLTSEGTLMLYNDGDNRASPFDPIVPDLDNYSSAEEFNIDDTKMQVSEVWNSAWQTNQDRLFTDIVGKAQWLPQTRDVLVTYGYANVVNGARPSPNPNATMVRLIEYTHDPIPQVRFDVRFWDDYGTNDAGYWGYFCYRSTRIPDLYAHPAEPVICNLVGDQSGTPTLEFSADPMRSYTIQASTDLTHWTTIGTPVSLSDQYGSGGFFYFDDFEANQFASRFYRVVTQ